MQTEGLDSLRLHADDAADPVRIPVRPNPQPVHAGADHQRARGPAPDHAGDPLVDGDRTRFYRCRSEEHTSELQSLMRISYAVFCLKKKNNNLTVPDNNNTSPH